MCCFPSSELEFSKKSPESWLPKIKKLSQTIQQKLLQFAVNNGAKLSFEKVENGNEVLVASFENDEKGEKIIKFLTNVCFLGNFVAHGSTVLWERCQIKKSNCAEKIAGNQIWLYCAKKPFTPIFRALVSCLIGFSPCSINCNFDKILGQFEYIETYFGFSGAPATHDYIYLLPKEFAR